jgi:hypothetical protein
MVPGSQWDGFRDASRKRGAQGHGAIDQSISHSQQPECDSLGLGPRLWKVGAQEHGVLKARDRNSVICNAETQSADHSEVSAFEVPWYNWTWGWKGHAVVWGLEKLPQVGMVSGHKMLAHLIPHSSTSTFSKHFLSKVSYCVRNTCHHARVCLSFNDSNSKKANVSGCVWFSDRD